MRNHLLLLIALSFVASAAVADEEKLPPPTGKAIVGKNAELELLFTRSAPIKGGLTEGPAVAPDGSIYFSDIPVGADKGLIMRFDPKTKKTSVFAENSHKSNGLIFNSKGFLLACEGADYGGRCVSRWNVETGQRDVLVDRFRGKHFNAPNDLCVDRQGRIYFSDPRYLGDEPRELPSRAVYRIEPDGSVEMATDNVVKPNGIAISPDGKTLYVADHDNGTDKIDPNAPAPKQGVMKIYAFDLSADGTVGDRKTIVDFGTTKGCDGMCVDEKGHVYLTVRDADRPGVMVIDTAGDEVAFIPTGQPGQGQADAVGLPSNVEFGVGGEANVLYVTVDKSLYRIPLQVKGFHVQYQ